MPDQDTLQTVVDAARYRERAMAEADRSTTELARRIDAAMRDGHSTRAIGDAIGLDHSRVVRIRKLAR